MGIFELVCVDCAKCHDSSRYRLACDACGGLLDVSFDPASPPPLAPTASAALAASGLAARRPQHGVGRFLHRLPIANATNLVTLGEGDTPQVALPAVAKALGLQSLQGKLELCAPTGSFKDRGNAVQVSVLKETGVTRVAEVAAGNAGHSFAAYLARAGIAFEGFAFRDKTDKPLEGTTRKQEAIEQSGARMHWIEGDRDACKAAMAKFCEETGTVNMTYARNPYFNQGNKTIAFEIVEQAVAEAAGSGSGAAAAAGSYLPEHIIVPLGNGSLLDGIWLGFQELIAEGVLSKGEMPQLHGVQAEAVQPFMRAYEDSLGTGDEARADSGATIAVGITPVAPPRLQAFTGEIIEAGGCVVTVSEEEILHWQERLNALEGLFVEATSATVLAAAKRLVGRGVVAAEERVLVVVTGSGFKEPMPRL